MNRYLLFALLVAGTIAGFADARGFGGGGGGPVGDGIGGSGALWTDSIMGSGGLWGDGAYGSGLPWFEGVPGGNTAYGGFFSGPPRLNMKHPETYNPLGGEQALGGQQLNIDTDLQRRQEFVGSLAGMGIGTGGFRPGQFGPPPEATGLPSDLGMHQAGGQNPHGYGGRGRSAGKGVSADADGGGARDWTAAELRVAGNAARSEFRDYSAFGRNWFAQYPRAWNTRGYVRDVWTGASWTDVTGWLGGDWSNYEYMYGSELTYDNNTVYLYGRPVAAADKYYESAVNIAQSGAQANANAGEWLPLGVFEAIRGSSKSSTMLFQLAVNKAGAIRGNYFDSADKNVQLVQGAVDKETQRVAWAVADKKSVVFDCVLFSLTRAETAVLVHLGPDKKEQWTFVRLAQPAGRR